MNSINIFSNHQLPSFNYITDVFIKCDTSIAYYTDYKISVILTNGMSCVYRDKIYQLSRGDVLLFHPNELHHGRILREGVHRYIEILIPLDLKYDLSDNCRWFKDILADSVDKKINHLNPDDESRSEIINISEDLSLLSDKTDEVSQLQSFADIVKLISICCSLYEKQYLVPTNQYIPATLCSALKYINDKYYDIKNLNDIAQHIGCSVTYLSRLFSRYVGETALSYLTDYRLEQAKHFLMNGSSVTDACYRSGFGDCSHFIRVFKKHEGITPLAYKKRIQQGK